MPETENFDLIVLGGGPGGYVAAIRAAQLGMRTALVEREHLGGICLNWGCIPTKALLRSSEINHLLHHLDEFGFAADNIRFDLAHVVKRSRAVAKQLASGVGHLLKKNRVTVIDGHGRLAGGHTLTVEKNGATRTLTSPHIILATGARARQLPGLETDGKLIWSYKDAMVPAAMPKQAHSASSSPVFSRIWAPRSRCLKCSSGFFPPRTTRFPPSHENHSNGRA
jgi:dihydrolipoamide dehydrogenase